MLKSQDCVILIKLLANSGTSWTQRELAAALCISLAEINGGIKRLIEAGLLRKNQKGQLLPNFHAAEEFLISGIKFFFPGKLGEYTRGIPTAVATPLFRSIIALGSTPVPVWPDAVGPEKGLALQPIHPAVPKALRKQPDQLFYEFLTLVDAIRTGKARERNLAAKLLKEKLTHANQSISSIC